MSPSGASTLLAASIPQQALMGILWSGTAFSIVVVAARLAIRLHIFGRFKLDDYIVLFALAVYLAFTLTWAVLSDDLYLAFNFTTEADLLALLNKFADAIHGNMASYICVWTCLWSIKLSFMVFFHGLGRQIKAQRILWWCVVAYIVATYAVSISLLDFKCLTTDGPGVFENCDTPRTLNYEYANVRATTVFDITTDALIILVSANIVWRAHLPWQKKVFLGFICSLTVFMMIVSIVRIRVGAPGKAPDLSWLLLWNSVEMTLAIFVACIASFRSLYCYTKSTRQTESQPSYQLNRSPPRRQFLSALGMDTMLTTMGIDTILSAENSEWVRQPSYDSQEVLYMPERQPSRSKDEVSSEMYQPNVTNAA